MKKFVYAATILSALVMTTSCQNTAKEQPTTTAQGVAVNVNNSGVSVAGEGASVKVSADGSGSVSVNGSGTDVSVSSNGVAVAGGNNTTINVGAGGAAVNSDDIEHIVSPDGRVVVSGNGTNISVGDGILVNYTTAEANLTLDSADKAKAHYISEATLDTLTDIDFSDGFTYDQLLDITKCDPLFQGDKAAALANGWGFFFTDNNLLVLTSFDTGNVANVYICGTYTLANAAQANDGTNGSGGNASVETGANGTKISGGGNEIKVDGNGVNISGGGVNISVGN